MYSRLFCPTPSYNIETGTVTESTPITEVSPRVERFTKAEEECTKLGGCALRLAGLYLLERGPHSYWLKLAEEGGKVKGNPAGLINMLHYDDAAGACLAALLAGPEACRGQTFLISDGHPLTRQEICESALQAAVYRGKAMPEFESQPDPSLPGKVYDGSYSNRVLSWTPRYESFAAFMAANA